jgi:hypothetical protein
VGLRQQQCCHNADQCTEENQGSFAHHLRTFSPSLVARHEINGGTVLAVPPLESGERFWRFNARLP